eukprot:TRINITY_DN6895_c0_g2_i1.p1 TRINITY_DN6895_c0_g2~~TRINITY_DN6895_c0_g2_i1.p1  ORF type:complete len:158 (+),score=30.26 TRINITY_DN6895_c0_g2_i1:46-519(+)
MRFLIIAGIAFALANGAKRTFKHKIDASNGEINSMSMALLNLFPVTMGGNGSLVNEPQYTNLWAGQWVAPPPNVIYSEETSALKYDVGVEAIKPQPPIFANGTFAYNSVVGPQIFIAFAASAEELIVEAEYSGLVYDDYVTQIGSTLFYSMLTNVTA